jgi:hypothetical protein
VKQRIICRVCDRSYVHRKDYRHIEGVPDPLCIPCSDRMKVGNKELRASPDEDGHYRQQCFRCFKVKRDDEYLPPRARPNGRGFVDDRAVCLACARQRRRITDARRRRPAWEFIKSYKDGKPCLDCKIEWPYYVLEFDHREPENKSYTISNMASTHWREKDWPEISEEIAKCDLVCRNCHVIRSHGRGNRGAKRIYHPSDEDITVCSGMSAETSPVAPSEAIVLHEEDGVIPEPTQLQQLCLFDLDRL